MKGLDKSLDSSDKKDKNLQTPKDARLAGCRELRGVLAISTSVRVRPPPPLFFFFLDAIVLATYQVV